MTIAPESLPDDIAALKRIIAEMARDAVAAKAEIANLKFQLARYRRAEFGRSLEKLTREIDSSTAIESLESDQAERLAAASPMVAAAIEEAIEKQKPARRPLPSICRVKRCITRPPAPARTAAAPCGGSARM